MKYENLISTQLLQSEDIYATSEKSFIADDVFAILSDAYRDVKGGLNFKDVDDLIFNTSLWKVIYLNNNIVGVMVYKAKRGLKMVALGIANFLNKTLTRHVKTIFTFIFKNTFRSTWMEVSDSVERFVLKSGGQNFIVENTLASALTGKEIISCHENGYHYKREINGILKDKVIIGTAKL